MCRMPKTLLALVAVFAASLLTGCNSYNRPTTQIGYWPDYEEQNSLNDSVLNARDSSALKSGSALSSNAPIPGANQPTYIAPAPVNTNVESVSPAPAPAAAPVQTPIFVTPGPAPAPAAPILVAPSPRPAPVPRGAGTYIVKNGDSLWKIARKHYGSGLRWKEIAAANPTINPDRLKLGQRLTLPVIGRTSPVAGAAAASRPANRAAAVEDDSTFK